MGTAIAIMSITGGFNLRRNDVFLEMIPKSAGVIPMGRDSSPPQSGQFSSLHSSNLSMWVGLGRVSPLCPFFCPFFLRRFRVRREGLNLGLVFSGRIEAPPVSWWIVSSSSVILLDCSSILAFWVSITSIKRHSPLVKYGQLNFKFADKNKIFIVYIFTRANLKKFPKIKSFSRNLTVILQNAK